MHATCKKKVWKRCIISGIMINWRIHNLVWLLAGPRKFPEVEILDMVRRPIPFTPKSSGSSLRPSLWCDLGKASFGQRGPSHLQGDASEWLGTAIKPRVMKALGSLPSQTLQDDSSLKVNVPLHSIISGMINWRVYTTWSGYYTVVKVGRFSEIYVGV
jgi:hypothetical protein